MLTSLDYYRIFYYVAKYRNFTRAADVLLTSQPTVTRTIKKSRKRFGLSSLYPRKERRDSDDGGGTPLFLYCARLRKNIERGRKARRGNLLAERFGVCQRHRDFFALFPFGKIGAISRQTSANPFESH